MTFAKHDIQVEQQDLRLLLREELVSRISKNPRYSLRAFAKVLKIQPPTLSHILNGKRKVPQKTAHKILLSLGLSPEQMSQLSMNNISTVQTRYSQFATDTFNVISEWYHFAILELIRLPNFKSDTKWIAKCLNISVNEVSAAIERLIRIEMLEITKNGQWRVLSPNNTTTGSDFTSAALKKVQKQYLQKALEALDEVPLEKRDQSGVTVAISLADMPTVKEKIKKFRRDLAQFVELNKKPDEVYQLAISFYPLTKNRE